MLIRCIKLAFISLHAQISEKQKSLYEALERQQHYQESLQSISTKMESIEGALNEGLEPKKTPESQMAAHQVRIFGISLVLCLWSRRFIHKV